MRSWAKHERQTVARALAEALHHSAPRRPKTARAGVRPGVLEDPGPRRETEHEQHAAPRGLKPPSPGEPSLATPVLAGQATKRMDSATLRFLTASALRRTKKEEEEQAKVKRKEEERRMKRINEMVRFELPVSIEEREAWRRWIASSSSSSSGKRRKRKKKRKRKVPKSSSSCSSRSSFALRSLDIISVPGAWFDSGYILLCVFWWLLGRPLAPGSHLFGVGCDSGVQGLWFSGR